MAGILADAGFKFQQKVVIYYILEALINANLNRCNIELQIKVTGKYEKIVSFDFQLETGDTLKYFEIKDQMHLHKKANLKPIIEKFYRLFSESEKENRLFILLHSSQANITHLLKGLYLIEENERVKSVSKILDLDSSEKLVKFTKQIKPQRMDNTVDSNFNRGTIELRSIYLIRKIYQEYKIRRYGWAETTYNAIENVIQISFPKSLTI